MDADEKTLERMFDHERKKLFQDMSVGERLLLLEKAAESLWNICDEFMSDRCVDCQAGKECKGCDKTARVMREAYYLIPAVGGENANPWNGTQLELAIN